MTGTPRGCHLEQHAARFRGDASHRIPVGLQGIRAARPALIDRDVGASPITHVVFSNAMSSSSDMICRNAVPVPARDRSCRQRTSRCCQGESRSTNRAGRKSRSGYGPDVMMRWYERLRRPKSRRPTPPASPTSVETLDEMTGAHAILRAASFTAALIRHAPAQRAFMPSRICASVGFVLSSSALAVSICPF